MSASIDPRRTALIVVDMQNGFVLPSGPISVPNAESLIPKISRMVDFCRTVEIPVVWTRVNLDGFGDTAYPELWPGHFPSGGGNVLSKGAYWHQIVGNLVSNTREGDLMIDKDRYDAFFQTNLELRLRQAKVRDLLVCGVSTNVCVEGTIRGAFDRGFRPFLLSDCTATFSNELQELAQTVISLVCGFVVTSDEAVDLIEAGIKR